MSDSDSDRNRSEIEPIEVIFRKIAQQRQVVPRSTEQGASYQAAHDPVPSLGSASPALEPRVVLDITTDPDSHRTEGSIGRGWRWGAAVILFASGALLAATWLVR